MTLIKKINDDFKVARINGDKQRSLVLSTLKSSILNFAIDAKKKDSIDSLEDQEIEQIIQKEIKNRVESAAIYKKAGRDDLASNELAEVDIMKAYLPKQMSDDELTAIVEKVISVAHCDGDPKSLGVVITNVKKQVGSAADGARIANFAKKLLSREK